MRSVLRYLNTSHPPEDAVTVLPPVYFNARYDPSQLSYLQSTCQWPEGLSDAARQVCRHLVATGFSNTLAPSSVADHHWMHTYWSKSGYKRKPLDSVPAIGRRVALHFNVPYRKSRRRTRSTTDKCFTPRLKFGPFR